MIAWLDNLLWGGPLLILLFGVSVYLTVHLKGVQFRYFWYCQKLIFTQDDSNAQGDMSHFAALMTALAATIGMGSIAGVATAIVVGGYGSLFWMWVTSLLVMVTKYAEAILAIKYRVVDEKGEMCGGPMYYLERGLKQKWLGVLFAIFGVGASFGIGNIVQSNAVAESAYELMRIDPIYMGLLMMVLTGVSIIGGIKSISRIVSILVPAMALFYIVGGLVILCAHIIHLPGVFLLIFKTAFTGQAAMGGFLGAGVMAAIQYGVSRGVFSSEAGMGSSPIAAAAAKTGCTVTQALVSMSSVFITTGIVCTITGVVIALSGKLGAFGANGELLNGSALALSAFNALLPYGGMIVTLAVIPFAYSTILGWAYYGEKCMEYLFGLKVVVPYRIVFTLFMVPGAFMSLDFVWHYANLMNGLMAIPNLIALVCLVQIVKHESRLLPQ
ncbi:MAG: sodium:alanine symporter family protein [Simkaniaceae bacterium]|nr:sodium:alanine symporter family protein [Simkaniaceae bacterium]